MIPGAIVDAARALVRDGLTVGTSGNISARGDDRVWITPSGVEPADLDPADIVQVDLDGALAGPSARRPSSELPFHLGILRARDDVGAIVHTHSPWATAVSCTRRALPPFHYMMVGTGDGTVECAPYDPPGSPSLAANVVAALGSRQACLLANHGVVAVGNDVASALAMAREVEALAQQYCLAQMIGGPELLSDAEVGELIEVFQSYRQRMAQDAP